MKHVGGLSRSPRGANPQVPEELDALVARLLSRYPEDRYPDAIAFVEDLERIVEGLPPGPRRRPRAEGRDGGRPSPATHALRHLE